VAPANGGTAFDALFKIGFVVVLIVAAFFIYRTFALQSQLKQAKSENGQVQQQLDKARADVGKAEANANGLSEEKAKLLSQLEQAKAEGAAAKADAAKAAGDLAKLQPQLERAKHEAADAKASAEKAAGDLAKLQAQIQAQSQSPSRPIVIDTTPAKAPVASLRPVPVNVSFRKASVGEGKAVVLQNISGSALTVNVVFTNPTASRSKDYRLVIDAGTSKELGSLGAWLLASGDRIEIESPGYNSLVKTAP
jgi:hypothetical protein